MRANMTSDDEDESDLFTRIGDPATSRDAAAKIDVTRLRGMIIQVLRGVGLRGLTGIEIARATDIHPWSITPRLRPMVRDGLVETYGKRPCVNSEGNMREMLVWRLKT
jgi:hypothetical protein